MTDRQERLRSEKRHSIADVGGFGQAAQRDCRHEHVALLVCQAIFARKGMDEWRVAGDRAD